MSIRYPSIDLWFSTPSSKDNAPRRLMRCGFARGEGAPRTQQTARCERPTQGANGVPMGERGRVLGIRRAAEGHVLLLLAPSLGRVKPGMLPFPPLPFG